MKVIRRLRLLFVLAFLWPLSASAANLKWMESGTDATQDLTFYSATAGTVASASDQSHTGLRSVKLSTGSPAAAASADRSAILADAGRRCSGWVRYDTTPPGTVSLFVLRSGTTTIFNVTLGLSGTIGMAAAGTADSVVGATATSTGTWFRLSFVYTITSTTVYTGTVYLNGVSQGALASNGTLAGTGSTTLRLAANAGIGANANVWFDDIVCDDGTSGDIGGGTADALHVTNKRPNANGSANTFDTTTGTGSAYGTGNSPLVNEQPLSTASRRSMAATTGSKIEAFAIENLSTGDVNFTGATQVGYLSWIHGSGVSTDTIYTNNAAAVPDGPATVSTTAQVYWRITTSASYPTGDQSGMGRPTGNATDAVFNEGGVLFAYTPAAVGTAPNRLMLLGVK